MNRKTFTIKIKPYVGTPVRKAIVARKGFQLLNLATRKLLKAFGGSDYDGKTFKLTVSNKPFKDAIKFKISDSVYKARMEKGSIPLCESGVKKALGYNPKVLYAKKVK
jgi:hypothetical protein